MGTPLRDLARTALTFPLLFFLAAVDDGTASQAAMTARAQILRSEYAARDAGDLLTEAIRTRDLSHQDMVLALLVRRDEVLPILRERLRTAPDAEKYDLLMLTQGQLRWSETKPAVLELLRNRALPERVRGRAATASALFQNRDAIPDVRELLASAREDQVRQWAAFSLGMLGDADSRAPIEAMLSDASPYVRAAAAGALGMLGVDTGAAVALALSRHHFFGVRCRAADALSYIGTPTALARLREMLESDVSPTVRNESAEYLARAEIDALGRDEAILRLKGMLTSTNGPPPRWAFVYFTDHFGDEESVFIEGLAETPGPLQKAATVALLRADARVAPRPRMGRSR